MEEAALHRDGGRVKVSDVDGNELRQLHEGHRKELISWLICFNIWSNSRRVWDRGTERGIESSGGVLVQEGAVKGEEERESAWN